MKSQSKTKIRKFSNFDMRQLLFGTLVLPLYDFEVSYSMSDTRVFRIRKFMNSH